MTDVVLYNPELLDEEPNQHLVFERENPVTISAALKADAVTDINKMLDQLYVMQTCLENLLLTIDRGG